MATRITHHPLSTVHSPMKDLPEDVALAARLRRSFNVLLPGADAVAHRFYEGLFAAHPALRAMFPSDLERQRRLLMETLQWIVIHLGQRDKLADAIEALGRRHAGYGARAEHFAPVVEHLVEAMSEIAGPKWTADDRSDWQTALTLIADRMANVL